MNFSYRWVIVATGALMTCVGIGAMFSLAVYLEPMSANTGWSRAGISSAMTLDFLVMGVASFAWGAASDRFGTRIVVLTGAVLLGLGLLLASRATSLIEFQLTYGILVGLAAGSFFAPMIAATTTWFVSNRSLAVSLVSAGMGVAPMTISPFARWLISAYDWRVAMMTIGIAAWILLVPAALLVRRPAEAANDGAAELPPSRPTCPQLRRSTRRNFWFWRSPSFSVAPPTPDPSFIWLVMRCSAACRRWQPSVSTVSRAWPGLAAVFCWACSLTGSASSACSSPAFWCRHWRSRPISLLIGSVSSTLLAMVFGTAYGGVMPLYAVLAREYFGQRVMGTVFGAATMASSIGMAFGPLAGGWIFDTFNSYRWLYLGSFSVALAAVAIALAFPRLM